MASGIFALLDDIGALMDDVAAMSKITTQKTAGILGDDLAVNAEKASGFVSSREIPVLWAITKGSFLNKLIILPIAFLLTAYIPWMVNLILVLGGVYLAYEGAEKIYHYIKVYNTVSLVSVESAIVEDSEDTSRIAEKKKIKDAIVTDFILSIEIVIIALSTVVGRELLFQVLVVSIVAIIATIGVYGIVALIVRMDDFGFALLKRSKSPKSFYAIFGNFLVQALPKVIKSLSVIGTVALLLVSGGIFLHNVTFLEGWLSTWPSILAELVMGLAVGVLVLILILGIKKIVGLFKKP